MYPLPESRARRCVSATLSHDSAMFQLADSRCFVLCFLIEDNRVFFQGLLNFFIRNLEDIVLLVFFKCHIYDIVLIFTTLKRKKIDYCIFRVLNEFSEFGILRTYS